jgi:hypothetical protein
MSSPDPGSLHRIAEECVELVAQRPGQRLDWSLASLAVLDDVCGELLEGDPLRGKRLDL